MLRFLIVCLISAVGLSAKTSSHLFRDLEKVSTLGSVLYIAAHPDDENTALLAYLSQYEHLDVAYLSLTRGSGGQNHIGHELGEGLGVIRTQELLAAREIDHAEQLFSSAVDFGFSLTSEETLRFWGEEEILRDTVKIIREYKPDVVIVRFHPDDKQTHGHHQAATQIAMKAFDLAANPEAFEEELGHLEPHQADRLYWDAYWWDDRYKDELNNPFTLSYDLSRYDSLLGESYSEISRRALGKHKSQGVVFPLSRSAYPAKLVLKRGQGTKHLLENIDSSWNRIDATGQIKVQLDEAKNEFSLTELEVIIPRLLKVKSLIDNLEDSVWKSRKTAALNTLIAETIGLFVDARVDQPMLHVGERFQVDLELANRSSIPIQIGVDSVSVFSKDQWPNREQLFLPDHLLWELEAKQLETPKIELSVHRHAELTTPYWLAGEKIGRRYGVENLYLVGLGENPKPLEIHLRVNVVGEIFQLSIPIVHRTVDIMRGEERNAIGISDRFNVSLAADMLMSANGEPLKVAVNLHSLLDSEKQGRLKLEYPDEWEIDTNNVDLAVSPDGSIEHVFSLIPKANATDGIIGAVFEVEGEKYVQSLRTIDYPHIPRQSIHQKAEARVIHVKLQGIDRKIGYFQGAGDKIPDSLRLLGFEVTDLEFEELGDLKRLSEFDAVVFGIRAYNTHADLETVEAVLLDYVNQGGNWIVQSISPRRLKSQLNAPLPIRIGGRARVTDETATIRFLLPDHPVLNTPNRITSSDFDDWVQERGLYFAETWDKGYDAVLSSNDPERDPQNGGLLITSVGEGNFIYTGYSFFRQVPAGVTGSIKLLSNILSLEGPTK